uniref:Uncharacterized protein n=1 Tax=Globodera rostochiensis TaxID=31243 RepID=A0A914HXF8_GLORO
MKKLANSSFVCGQLGKSGTQKTQFFGGRVQIGEGDDGKNDALIHVFKKDGAIPNGLALLQQRRQEEDMIKLVEEIDLNEDDNIESDFSIEL